MGLYRREVNYITLSLITFGVLLLENIKGLKERDLVIIKKREIKLNTYEIIKK